MHRTFCSELHMHIGCFMYVVRNSFWYQDCTCPCKSWWVDVIDTCGWPSGFSGIHPTSCYAKMKTDGSGWRDKHATKSDLFVLLKRLGFVGFGFVFSPYNFLLCDSLPPLQGCWSNSQIPWSRVGKDKELLVVEIQRLLIYHTIC